MVGVDGDDGANCARPRLHAPLPQPLVQLKYTVDRWSSYSPDYPPHNITVDRPHDQSSRWSSGTNNQRQFITVKLEQPAVVGTITFGKYHKVHVCNLREFKVFGGMTPDDMIELLHSGLRNDDEPETFPLKHRVGGIPFPCLYIKVTPLLAWGANFNFSIWYLQLNGVTTPAFVERATAEFNAYREREALRLCLKHFRQRNYVEVFDSLQKRCKLELEHPLLTSLHRAVVVEGDFEAAEALLRDACDSGSFDASIRSCSYKPRWQRLRAEGPAPCMRGGHQMCIDTVAQQLYLLGGWDGANDLGDFWRYDIREGRWTLLAEAVAEHGGPSPRSCHKMCLDRQNGLIYVLGGFMEPVKPMNADGTPVAAPPASPAASAGASPSVRGGSGSGAGNGGGNGGSNHPSPPSQAGAAQSPACDFYVYDIASDRWTAISRDVHADGGPQLIYDHQLCIDTRRQRLYVFGGRMADTQHGENHYSGLYTYDIRTAEWRLVRNDGRQPLGTVALRSRIGHCMLLNPREQVLYVFAGQRHKEYLSDFYVYDIETDTVIDMQRDVTKVGGPDAGFTQRATIDLDLGEIYMLSGLMRDRNTTQDLVKNCFWVYSIATETWTRVYQNDAVDPAYWAQMQDVEPCPRYAHQLVYDYHNKVHYLFGGNPGNIGTQRRLDDLWRLELHRPGRSAILRRALQLVRRQQFREMCASEAPMDALRFLQTRLSETVDHDDPAESAAFRQLSTSLFQQTALAPAETFALRTALYEELLQFFPDTDKQPRDNLVDLVKLG